MEMGTLVLVPLPNSLQLFEFLDLVHFEVRFIDSVHFSYPQQFTEYLFDFQLFQKAKRSVNNEEENCQC